MVEPKHLYTLDRSEKKHKKLIPSTQLTITQVLVVLAFRVDIFTIAWSFFSCSIKDLQVAIIGLISIFHYPSLLVNSQNYLHVLFLQHLDLLL